MASNTTYNSASPYFNTPIATDLVTYLSYMNFRNVPYDATDPKFIIPAKYHMKPGRLAYDLYGTAEYWWVFAMRNPDIIKDPVFDMITGVTIYLPQRANLSNI